MNAAPRRLQLPARLALAFLIVLAVLALLSLMWTPFAPDEADPYRRWLGPSWPHLLGTDGTGRDILSRLLVGTRTTLLVAMLSGVVAGAVGLGLGVLTALGPRPARRISRSVLDVLIAFPTLLTAMMLASTFGSSLGTVIAAVGASLGVSVARVLRTELVRVASAEYVLAARAAGVSAGRSFWTHVLPNVSPVLTVQLSNAMAIAVLAEAGLSYLGYGASPATPSWGRLLSETQAYLDVHPLTVVWPGLAVTLTVLSFSLLGDALRDWSDPRARYGRPARPRDLTLTGMPNGAGPDTERVNA
ncbi:ABC transporter permease [Deinococcus hopiensis]|uniref:Peptide/nickel transport system permease protein n=1 Tax=Deinococcus hopiensis KR-140 TaxID=695939 RepID=A0A1W1UW36_9DEIO|nr:ABC transporter permease [Deinococcus hopiensis]SMB85260.1 peptide/nickel transport system permease protein [Deinococcus hopiensis KR-140]